MAESSKQPPEQSGSGYRWLRDVVLVALLGFTIWLGPGGVASIITDVRSATARPSPTAARSLVPAPTASLTPTAAQSLVPAATIPPTPSPVSPLAPGAIMSLTPMAAPALAPAATIALTPTTVAPPTSTATSFFLGDFKNGAWLEQVDPNLASAIKDLSWVQDGIDDAEAKAIQGILYVALASRRVASSLVSLSWVRDGIDDAEADLIDRFPYLVREDSNTALRIIRMPFLKSIEPPDLSALESLTRLAISEPETFDGVMSYPVLRDGISDDLVPIVATLHGVAATNPALIDVLLNPGNVVLELRTVTLPLSGEVVLSIIRTGPGAARSMELLEHSVRTAEEYMGAPLPTNYVGLLYANAVAGSTAGTNFGTHIGILPEFDVDDGSREAAFAVRIIAHEVAHDYWRGNANWVDEGAADLVASIIEGARNGHPIEVSRTPCVYARNIAELESLIFARDDVEFECNYSLGERLFVDLYRTLGAERFRQGFRELYLVSKRERDTDNNRGTSVGVGHVKEAFRLDDGAANIVIARWYDGTEPYDLSHVDTSPVDPTLSSINGRIQEVYLTAGEGGPRVSSFSAQDVSDWIILTIECSYEVSGGPHEVPLEIVEYYEDGFAFRRGIGTLIAEGRYIGGTMRFSAGMPPSQRWATGHYAVFVYAGGQKVAEVYYEVTP